MQIDYISHQFRVFFISSCCFYAPITKYQNLVRNSQTIKSKFWVIQSPSDTQPSRYDMLCRAVSFLFSIHSARWFSHRISTCPVCCHAMAAYLVPYVAILSRPLFILILPPILFRQFQKFSKPLNSLSLHLPSIHFLSIMFEPSIQPSLWSSAS